MALDGYGAIGVVIPKRRATSMIESMPTRMPSCTATELRDRTSASRMRHWSEKRAVGIVRPVHAPVREWNRQCRVSIMRVGGDAVSDRGCVDEWLERGPGLADGI